MLYDVSSTKRIDFLSIPGYIAGVTNPMFETHSEWWDILCNINTGKITVNQMTVTEKHVVLDNEFMAQMNAVISSHYGEDTVRSLFQSYTQHIVDMAFDEEEFADENSRSNELECSKQRIENWNRSVFSSTYKNDRKIRREVSAIKDPAVPRYIKKLRTRKSIPENEMIKIYQTFVNNIKTEEQLLEFLSYLPESNGGLYPVAVSLFHSSESVRVATARLFQRLDKIQTGSGFIAGLNYFLFLAYNRISKELEKK